MSRRPMDGAELKARKRIRDLKQQLDWALCTETIANLRAEIAGAEEYLAAILDGRAPDNRANGGKNHA